MKKFNKFVASLLIVGTLVGMAAGCSSSGQTSASPSGMGTANQQQEMEIGIPKVTESFNFYNTTNGYESYSMVQVYDTLVIKNDKGKISPCLAESWKISPDGKEYTFHIKKGVKFSDGTELKASDIVYSFQQAIASGYTSWIYKPLIAGCTATDDYTVNVKMKKGSDSFLDYLSNINYFAVLSEKAVKKYGKAYGTSADKIVGTGAYKVLSWKPGEYVVYTANNDYFMGKPSIQNVRLKSFSDPNTAVVALQTGEIQAYFDDVPGVSYDAIKGNNNLKVVNYASTNYFEIIMNCKNGLFSDINVRKAVAMAVDRSNLMTVGTENHGVVADYPGNRNGYTAGDPQVKNTWYKTDLAAAKQLIQQAGVAGKSVMIKTYSTDPYPALATILQDALTKIGLNAKVSQMERSSFIDEVTTKGDFEIGVCRWAAGTTDMDEIWYGSLHTDSIGASGNWSWYSNKTMDDLLVKAGSELNENKRKEMYKQAISIFDKDIPQIPLYYPNGSRAYNKNLKIDDGLVQYDRIFNYSMVK